MSADDRDTAALVQRAINRPLSSRIDSATADVERIIEATYSVIGRTGTMDPTMREILKAADLSTQRFYRYFASKDELLLAILDDGRRRLAAYLERRLDHHATGAEKIEAWVEGMFAQASDTEASERTRPFITNRYRLMEQYPDEMKQTINVVSESLTHAVEQAADEAGVDIPDDHHMTSAYFLTVARMEEHIVLGTKPSAAEVAATLEFTFRALGLASPN